MKYLDDMLCKHGFDDGNSNAPWQRIYRRAYIVAINALAIKHKSRFRAVAFDRQGMHNSCMIAFADEGVTRGWAVPDFYSGMAFSEACQLSSDAVLNCGDAAMDEAIAEAQAMNLDECVRISASLNINDLRRKLRERNLMSTV